MKGVFYSAIVLILLVPLVMLAATNINLYQHDSERIKTRVISGKLAAFTKSIESDMPHSIDIISKRSIGRAVVYVETNGALNDSALILRELMINGTLNGSGSSNFTLTSWALLLRQKGELYGFDTEIRIINVSFSYNNSYNIGVEVGIEVNATKADMALYRIYKTTAFVSIEGFDDPLYTLKTNGILKRTVKSPNMTITGQGFDDAVRYGFYMPSSEGPGFLDRLEGRLRNGKYGNTGLESVVYLPSLQANGLAIKEDQSNIDYLYFDPTIYPGTAMNQSFYSWLRIDSTHMAVYNISG